MKLLIKPDNNDIKKLYETHTTFNPGDAGLDLFCPEEIIVEPESNVFVDLKIKCEAIDNDKDSYIKDMHLILTKLFTEEEKKSDLINKFKNLKVQEKNSSYYLYPRSSISKTGLMLANSTGIIDAGYRGNIIAAFYNNNKEPYTIKPLTRLVQICAPNLENINIKIVDSLSDTIRGENGFGSTGN